MNIRVTKEKQSQTFVFSEMITTAEELQKHIDFTDPHMVACAVIMALAAYEKDPSESMKMMDAVMGDGVSPSRFDEDFLKNQFRQYPYVARSYFAGASPANAYQPESYTLTAKETPYSHSEDGYIKLYFTSGGADHDRGMTLKQTKDGKWYLFSDTYKGLTSGIRAPE